MGKNGRNSKLFLFAAMAAIAVQMLLAACSQKKRQAAAVESIQKEFVAPITNQLSQLPEKNAPRVIFLDTVPPPRVAQIRRHKNIRLNKEENNKLPDNVLVNDAAGRGLFSTLTTDDGLTLDQVYCSYKDKWGNLWFGTNGGGVSKYDGKNFTTYTTAHGLASNVIWCIKQDRNDNIWFGTDGNGVSKYNGESFTNYTTKEGLADNVVFCIEEDKQNSLWFGTLKGGVSKWDGKRFVNYSMAEGLGNNAVRTILEDRAGNVWLGTLGGGISKWNGKSFANYATTDGLVENKVWCIAQDSIGNLWFGTQGKGLSKYDGKSFTNYTIFPPPYNDAVLSIACDKSGTIWLGTQNSGVVTFKDDIFTRYTTSNGLANNQIRAITKDEQNNLWFSSFGSGVCRFAGNSFNNFTTAQGLASNIVFSICEDKQGTIWLGTSGGGACSYDGKQFSNFTTADGLARNEIYCVYNDKSGNLWFGTSGSGVTKYDGKNFTTYTTSQGLANNIVFSITEDRAGNIWFGTSGGGVSKFDGKSFTNFSALQGLAGNVVFSIKEDKGANLWFGTLGQGVSRFDGKSFTNYTIKQGLMDNVVWSITEDDQRNLWFATQHGLSLLSKNSSDVDTHTSWFQSFTTADGLPNNFTTQVVQGDAGQLYVGTNLGIGELIPLKQQNAGGKTFRVGRIFNSQHGYPVKDVNAGLNAMFKDSKGIIWVGTGSDKTGLVRFEPGELNKAGNSAPQIYINQIKINNEAVSWRNIASSNSVDNNAIITDEMITYGRTLTDAERDSLNKKFAGIKFTGISKWHPLPQELVLPYYFNNVSFNFGVIETGKNFLVNYKYFLEGYDKDWSPVTHSTDVNFGNINEGSYTFKVKAQSPEGVWSEPVSYKFRVLPPWWRTWWMFVVYFILILASIILIIQWRHKRILRQTKILEHKVSVATKQVREETEKVQLQRKKAEEALTELKATQAQLIQSEKMASLGELTAGIAHEIQNPLNFVNNFSDVSNELIDEMKSDLDKGNLQQANLLADEIKQNLEKINHHGKRAGSIVKGMLQHSRTSADKKELTDINVLVDEYQRLAYHGLKAKDKDFNVKFETDFDSNIGKINLIPQEIGRVILNLVSNAFYAVNEKKKHHANGYIPLVRLSTKKIDRMIEISIIDNGPGIPERVKEKIFQPFFTTKPAGEGTGLGLSLSYDIITKGHGGELKLETKEGEGSKFTIELSVHDHKTES